MAKLTKGTEVYFLDPVGDVVTKLACPTNVTGLNAPKEQIPVSCLDSLEAEFLPGLAQPGPASLTIQFDWTEPSHVRLYEMWQDPDIDIFPWAIGFSDDIGTPPTSGDSTGFVLPTTRSWLDFFASITDVPFDISLNSVYTSVITLQVSGAKTLTPATT